MQSLPPISKKKKKKKIMFLQPSLLSFKSIPIAYVLQQPKNSTIDKLLLGIKKKALKFTTLKFYNRQIIAWDQEKKP